MTKFSRLDYVDTITVLVGANENAYTIHESALTARSAFFRAAIAGGFKESGERVVRLPEVDVESWATYVHWIYSHEIITLDPSEVEGDQTGSKRKNQLIHLYTLADILDDMSLRNEVVDSYKELAQESMNWNSASLPQLLSSIPEHSKFRKLILDYALRVPDSSAEFLKEHGEQLPRSFLVEIATAVLNAGVDKGNFTAPANKPACAYHEHDDSLPPCT